MTLLDFVIPHHGDDLEPGRTITVRADMIVAVEEDTDERHSLLRLIDGTTKPVLGTQGRVAARWQEAL